MNTPLPTATKYQGLEGEDPTAPFWGSGNYVGPYWSNGKVQNSVEWGDKPALNELDELARKHDAAYAHFKDEKHREAADAIFAADARKLKKKYGNKLAEDPQFAANMVEYGNHTVRQLKKLVSSGLFNPALAPLAIMKYGYEHVKEFTNRIKGSHLKNEMSEIRLFHERGTTGRKQPELSEVRAGRLANSGSWKKPTIDALGKASGWAGIVAEGPIKRNAVANAVLPTGSKRTVRLPQVSPLEENSISNQLARSQAARFERYRALHDAALASNNCPRVYQKRKLNMDKAKPKKNKQKRNAVRPL